MERKIFLFKQWLGNFWSYGAKGSNHHIPLELSLHMSPELPYRSSSFPLHLQIRQLPPTQRMWLARITELKACRAPDTQSTLHPGDNESLPFQLFSIHKALGKKRIRICWKCRSFHLTYSVLISLRLFFHEQRNSKEDIAKAGICDMCLVNKQENTGQKVITGEKLKLAFLFFLDFPIHCLPTNSKSSKSSARHCYQS